MNEQARSELAVFEAFIVAAGLNVAPGSVEKRAPPEPDILCQLCDLGTTAFELVEVIDSGFAQMVSDQIRVERALCEAVEGLEMAARDALRSRLRDALVFIRYAESTARA